MDSFFNFLTGIVGGGIQGPLGTAATNGGMVELVE
jgi:hypothetical protein